MMIFFHEFLCSLIKLFATPRKKNIIFLHTTSVSPENFVDDGVGCGGGGWGYGYDSCVILLTLIKLNRSSVSISNWVESDEVVEICIIEVESRVYAAFSIYIWIYIFSITYYKVKRERFEIKIKRPLLSKFIAWILSVIYTIDDDNDDDDDYDDVDDVRNEGNNNNTDDYFEENVDRNNKENDGKRCCQNKPNKYKENIEKNKRFRLI